MSITIEKKYPNVIIFASKTFEGILASFIIKQNYDNNLMNGLWQKNVTVIFDQNLNLQWYKQKTKQNLQNDQQNKVYILNCNLNNELLRYRNWLLEQGIQLEWYDSNIDSIQNFKHFNIPGNQNSHKSTALLVWEALNSNITAPKSLLILSEIFAEDGTYSNEKEAIPLSYFIESLGKDINNNQNEMLISNLSQLIESKEDFIQEAIFIGKFVYNYKKQNQF